MNVDDVEKTSLVDDVCNTIIGGCDLDPDDEDSKEPEIDSGKESSKTNVDPQSAVQDDKCITYCDRLLELLGPVVQKPINANLGLNLLNLGLNFNPRLLCVVQS
jgi:hypothetical protein